MIRTLFIFLVFLSTLSPFCAGAADKPVVLFDRAHGERFVVGETTSLNLSSLAEVFGAAGYEVRESSVPFSDLSLSDADALVISGPFAQFSTAEIEAVARFVSRGGGLAIMLHIAPSAANLGHRFGVSASNGIIREKEGIIGASDTDFMVRSFEKHPLTEGVKEFEAHGVWGVMSTGKGEVIVRSGSTSWIDLDGDFKQTGRDATGAFGIVVAGNFGKGKFAVFGDDAIFQNKFLKGGNLTLARNLANWLKP